MFYFVSILISILVTTCSDVIIENKVKDMGYIYKEKKHSKISLIVSLSKYFIPYLNLISASIEALLVTYIMKHEDILIKHVSDGKPEYITRIYEKYHINNQDYKDTMILEGANEDVIDNEMKNIRDEENEPTYGYSEDDYKLARSIIAANQQLFEIECNTTLTNEQKQKLLRMYRNAYLKELNGNKKEDLKPINKTLELVKSK